MNRRDNGKRPGPKPRSARRSKQSALERHILAVAESWLAGDEEALSRADLDEPSFDAAINELTDRLSAMLQNTYAEFRAALRRRAAEVALPVTLGDGRQGTACGVLFLLPAYGPCREVARLVSDDGILREIAFRCQQIGVSPGNCAVEVIHGVLCGPVVASIGPGAIRQAGLLLVKRMLANRGAMVSDEVILAILGGCIPQEAAEADARQSVSRFIVGIRMAVIENHAGRAPASLFRFRDAEDIPTDAQAEPDAGAREHDAFWRAWLPGDPEGSGVFLGPPTAWSHASGVMAAHMIVGAVEREKAILGIPDGQDADHVHVHLGSCLMLCVECAGRLLGPIEVPKDLVFSDLGTVCDALVSLGGTVIGHELMETMPHVVAIRN